MDDRSTVANDGFWLPMCHEVGRQLLVATSCLVVVSGGALRITNPRGSVLLEGDLRQIEVHRTWLGNLRLRNAATGETVRLAAGATTNGSRKKSILDQVPPDLVDRRFDDSANGADLLLDPGGAVAAIPGEMKLTRRLADALVRRGAREV